MRLVLFTLAISSLHLALGQGLSPMDSIARKNELSMDVSAFIQQFTFNEWDPYGYPNYFEPVYLLSYKHSLGKGALRFGVGGRYSLESDTGGFNSYTDFTDYSWVLYLRAGWERRWSLSRRWSCYAGVDGLFGTGRSARNNMQTQAGRVEVRSTFQSVGGGPLLGIQFHLNRRISLYTESSLHWIYQETGDTFDYPDDTNDVQGLSTQGRITLNYPIAVWFAVAF